MTALAALTAFVEHMLRGVTYTGRYAATVDADHGDTVDITPDDEAMRGLGLQGVPKRTGVASGTSVVEPGTRCLFGFDNSDPRKPFIAAWEYLQHSAVVSFDGGAAPVARYGDVIRVITEPTLVVSGVAGGDVANPSPPPATLPLPPGSPFVGTATIVGTITGVIQAGASKVFA